MRTRQPTHARRAAAFAAGAIGAAALGYGAWAARTWLRYGCHATDRAEHSRATDPLDEFMPQWEVSERHAAEVGAPADATYAAARALDLNRSPLVRATFGLRTLPARLRGPVPPPLRRALVDETQALGWRILAERPGRILVMGAVTQPWKADVRFRGIDADGFAGFREPGYVKIVWTLEAEPLGPARSRFVTRTRVATTDAVARARFRRYWALVSPGVRLIRRASLGLVRRDAERRAAARSAGAAT